MDAGGLPCTTATQCPIDACTGVPSCEGGLCRYASPVQCDDGIPCTVDTCDPARGCARRPDNSLCDDRIACTTDVCDATQGCRRSLDDTVCADPHRCTLDRCTESGCVHLPDDTLCGASTCNADTGCTGVACTVDLPCQPRACERELSCVDGQCVVVAMEDDGVLCEDGDDCTVTSSCRAGVCVGDSFVQQCGACTRCDRESGGGCAEPVDAPDGTDCEDGDMCTGLGMCVSGECSAGATRSCEQRTCATAIGCNSATGCEYELSLAGTPCAIATADPCTIGECDGRGSCALRPRCLAPATCEQTTGRCMCPVNTTPCGNTCIPGTTCNLEAGVIDSGSPFDATVPFDAGTLIDATVPDGGICGPLGNFCTTATECPGTDPGGGALYTCTENPSTSQGECDLATTTRMICCGIAGAPCEAGFECLLRTGDSAGLCVTPQERTCLCARSSLYDCAATCI